MKTFFDVWDFLSYVKLESDLVLVSQRRKSPMQVLLETSINEMYKYYTRQLVNNIPEKDKED